MKRVVGSFLVLAVGLVFAACSDDTGTTKKDMGPPKGDGPIINVPEGGTDLPTGPTCDKANVGVPCTAAADGTVGGECTEGMTCLTTETLPDGSSRGVCTCECTPDDTLTPLVNEDNCPELSANSCAGVGLTDGSTKNFCFRKCDPKLGTNTCTTPLACNPRSGSAVGLFDSAVCLFPGCKDDTDCPVVTSTACKRTIDANGDPAASTGCTGTDECLPTADYTGKKSVDVDGLCAKPGKCDSASGICGVRAANFKADAKVGDPCKDDTECGANAKCEREVDTATIQGATNATCTEGSDCCSGTCTAGKCTAGTCGIHARNGYCYISSCAFASLTEFQCPTGSSCNLLFSGGLCMKDCDMTVAADCRGNATDKLGDYECRAWSNISIGGVGVSAGPVCDFGDTFSCNTFTSLGCDAFGADQANTTNMNCRDLTGTALTDPRDPLGFCLDDTASGAAN